jgi:hypothetical protein
MRSLNFSRYALTSCVAAAMFAGCGGSQPPIGASDAMPLTSAIATHADRSKAWMLPEATAKNSVLLYVAEMHGGVFVYDYKSGKRVGTLTGLHGPAGECVDARGDVYVTEYGNGEVAEYAHGGTSAIKKWTTSGTAFGCSVDKTNDLAVADSYTNSGPGQIEIFPKGGSKGRTYADPKVCYDMWPPGYDENGDLIVECAKNGVAIAALLHGTSRMVTLSYDASIHQPGGVMWDGKYIALTDENANNSGPGHQTGIEQATLSGRTLTKVGETVLGDSCNNTYAEILAPFIVGKKNTPVNTRQGTAVIGANLACNGSVGVWHYPKGDDPFREIGKSGSGYTQVVSIGQ